MPNRLSSALLLGLLVPLLAPPALAQGCEDRGVKISCAEGTDWDAAKQVCTPKPSA